MATIAVVGGGFGGLYALLRLERILDEGHKVLLFEPQERFIFTPLLHEVAGGVLHKESVTMPYAGLLRRTEHIRERVQHIDLHGRKLLAADKEYAFDYLLLAHGSRTNLYGKQYPVLDLKNYRDAVAIRTTIEQNVLKAAQLLANDHGAETDALLHVVVVGAGPSGVEIAGEAADLLRFRLRQQGIFDRTAKVTIISAREQLLPNLDPFFQRVATKRFEHKGITIIRSAKVTGIEGATLRIAAKDELLQLSAGCIIWTAGIAPNTIEPLQQEGAPVQVTPTLQLADAPFAFAVGDAAKIDTMPLPALAQVASLQGEVAAGNIARLIAAKELVPFSFTQRGMLISLGQRYGVGRVLGIPLKGFPAWFVMRTIYLAKFRCLRQEIRTAVEYTLRLFRRERRITADLQQSL